MTGDIAPAGASRHDVYDGFISYSHAADGLLAPRLQSALQRFAKPWWKRRAVRIFRDESSLSANPHLWTSITDALDTSEWFILLLSPDAATSEWVNQEIDYWTTHRDPSRILPVVTDGTFGWTHGDITGDAVPDTLRGVFSEEPRWVDVRWAKGEDQLDLQDPRFADAVADIASTIRAIPKDDLASEEVRQHRQTVRTAWAAGALVIVLALAAIGFGISSARNADEAEQQAAMAAEQAEFAATNAKDAEAHAAEAERQRASAEANAEDARQQTTLAVAASLASAARAELSADPELAVLLGLQSLLTADTDDGARALGQALQAHRAFLTLEPNDGVSFEGGGGIVPALAPGGELIATLELSLGTAKRAQLYQIADLVAEQRDEGTAVPLWTAEAGDDLGFWIAVFSVEGDELVAFEGPEALIGMGGQLMARSDEIPGRRRLVAFDTTTGEVTFSVVAPPCSNPNPMATGRPVDVSLPLLLDVYPEVDGSCDVTADRALVLFDLDTGETTTVTESYPTFGFGTGFPSLSRDGTRVAYAQGVPSNGHPPGAVIELATGEVLLELEGGDSMLSPDGSRVLTGSHADSPLELWDVDQAIKLREFPGDMNTSDFSPDGTIVYGGVTDGSIMLFDAFSGEELIRLRGQGTESIGVGMDERQSIMASFSIDGSTWLWDIGRQLIGDADIPDIVPPDGRFAGGFQHGGGRLAATSTPDSAPSGGPFRAAFYDPNTSELLFDLPGFIVAISPDGQTAAIQEWSEEPTRLTAAEAREIGCVRCENPPGGEYWSVGTVQVIDLNSLDVVAEMPALCSWLNHDTAELAGPECGRDGSRIDWITNASFSPDGRLLAMGGLTGVVSVWDPLTNEILWENVSQISSQASLSHLVSLEFSPDGSRLFAWTDSESAAVVLDTSTWDEVVRIPVGSSGFFTQAQFTPDGALLLVGDNLHHVVVIDTSTWERLEPLRGQSGNFLPDLDISPSGRFLATAGYGGNAWIWDLDDRSVVRKWTVTSGRPVWDVEFIDDDTVLIVPDGGSGAWAGVSMTLDTETQMQNALRRLTRSFTFEECETYGIEPCPTLADLRGE